MSTVPMISIPQAKLVRSELKPRLDKIWELHRHYCIKAEEALKQRLPGYETTYKTLAHKAQAVKECLAILEEV